MNVESWFQSLSYHHIWYECRVMISIIELSSYMIWMWSHDFSHWVIIIYDMNVESWFQSLSYMIWMWSGFQSLSYHHIWYECRVMISIIELSSYMIWMWSHDFSHWVIIIYDMNVESWFQSLSYMIWMWSHDFSHWVIIIYDMNVESWFQSLSYHHIWYECRVMISIIELSSYMIWMWSGFQSLSYHHIWYECRVMISIIELSSYMIWM